MAPRSFAPSDKGDATSQRGYEEAAVEAPAKGRTLYNGHTIGPSGTKASAIPAEQRHVFYPSNASQAGLRIRNTPAQSHSLMAARPDVVQYPSTVRIPQGIAHLLPTNVTNPATRKALRDGLGHLALHGRTTERNSDGHRQESRRFTGLGTGLISADGNRSAQPWIRIRKSDKHSTTVFSDDSNLSFPVLTARASSANVALSNFLANATSDDERLDGGTSISPSCASACCHGEDWHSASTQSEDDEFDAQSVEGNVTDQDSEYEEEEGDLDLDRELEVVAESSDVYAAVKSSVDQNGGQDDDSEGETLNHLQRQPIKPVREKTGLGEGAQVQEGDDDASERSVSGQDMNMWISSRRRGQHHKRARNPPPLVKKEDYGHDITIVVTSTLPDSEFSSSQARDLVDYLQSFLFSAYMAKRTLEVSDWKLVRAFTPALRTRRTLVYLHFSQLLKQKLTCEGEKAAEHGRNLVLYGRGLPEDFEETSAPVEGCIANYGRLFRYKRVIGKEHPDHLPWYLFAHFSFTRYVQPIQDHWPGCPPNVKQARRSDRPKDSEPTYDSGKDNKGTTHRLRKAVAPIQVLRRSTRALGTIIDPPPPLHPYDARSESKDDGTDGSDCDATLFSFEAQIRSITCTGDDGRMPGVVGRLSDENEPDTALTIPFHWSEEALIRQQDPVRASRVDGGQLRPEATKVHNNSKQFPMPRAVGFDADTECSFQEELVSDGDKEIHNDETRLFVYTDRDESNGYDEEESEDELGDATDGEGVPQPMRAVFTSRAALCTMVPETRMRTSIAARTHRNRRGKLRLSADSNNANDPVCHKKRRLLSNARLSTGPKCANSSTSSPSIRSLPNQQLVLSYDGQQDEHRIGASSSTACDKSRKPSHAGASESQAGVPTSSNAPASNSQEGKSQRKEVRTLETESSNSRGSVVSYASAFGSSTHTPPVDQTLGRQDLIGKLPVLKRRRSQVSIGSADLSRKHRKASNSWKTIFIGGDGKAASDSCMFVSPKKQIQAQPAQRRVSISGQSVSVIQASAPVAIQSGAPSATQHPVSSTQKDADENLKPSVPKTGQRYTLAEYIAGKAGEKRQQEIEQTADGEEGEISE